MMKDRAQSNPHRQTPPARLLATRCGRGMVLLLGTTLAWAVPPGSVPQKKPVAHKKVTHSVSTKSHAATTKTHSHLYRATAATETAASDSDFMEPVATGSARAFLYPHALDSFFNALSTQLSANAPLPPGDYAPTVRILQFGDSHTAADLFTGEMRTQLQTRFGNGGLGFQYPGHPFAGYRLQDSTRSQTAGWQTQGNHFNDLGDGYTGLGGIAISTSRPGQSITVGTTCKNLEIHYLRQPGGGRLRFTDNGVFISNIDTSTDSPASATLNSGPTPALPDTDAPRAAGVMGYACTAGVHEYQLTTLDNAPVRLLGIVTEQPGITYECIGINGAVAPLILRWNQDLFAQYLSERHPNLIVLAYGTNEATGDSNRNDEYVAAFHRLLQSLHHIAPDASILVLGPYDREVRTRIGRYGRLAVSSAIGRIIADQREACRVDNCTFYDQRARMGGPGAMAHWVARGLGQRDYTHLTAAGYRQMADYLYRDLMSLYQSYSPAPENTDSLALPKPLPLVKSSVTPAL
jgi:lysophospholipase L1-like esterase